MIQTFLVLGLIYSYFTSSLTPAYAVVFVYAMVTMFFFITYGGGHLKHYCKNCRTETKIITDAKIAEYETEPRRKVIQKQEPKLRSWKVIVTLAGAICSIAALVLYFANPFLYE